MWVFNRLCAVNIFDTHIIFHTKKGIVLVGLAGGFLFFSFECFSYQLQAENGRAYCVPSLDLFTLHGWIVENCSIRCNTVQPSSSAAISEMILVMCALCAVLWCWESAFRVAVISSNPFDAFLLLDTHCNLSEFSLSIQSNQYFLFLVF